MKSKNPQVSVIMAAYNAERYLAAAVESVLNQTFVNFEFIIIDDGSTDSSYKMIAEYAAIDSRIRLIRIKRNGGLVSALNTGIASAKGKYIARMDADDISSPKRLELQYRFMEENIDHVIVGSLAGIIDENGAAYDIKPFLLSDAEIRHGIAFRNQFCHGAVMLRARIINANSIKYSKTAKHYEDYELWPRVMKLGLAANLPEVLYFWRNNPTNITTTKKYEMRIGDKEVKKRQKLQLVAPALKTYDLVSYYRTYRSYRPNTVYIEGVKLNTHLHRDYQFLLYEFGMLNIQNWSVFSGAGFIFVSFSLNPLTYARQFLSRLDKSNP